MKKEVSFLNDQMHNQETFAKVMSSTFGEIYNIQLDADLLDPPNRIKVRLPSNFSFLCAGYFINITDAYPVEAELFGDTTLYLLVGMKGDELMLTQFNIGNEDYHGHIEDGLLFVRLGECVYNEDLTTVKFVPADNTVIPTENTVENIVEHQLGLRGEQKILLETAAHMNATQSLYFSERVSEQNLGIVVVWSRFDTSTNTKRDSDFHAFFIPKEMVYLLDGRGHTMTGAYSATSGTTLQWFVKYVYIADDKISGYQSNNVAPNSNMVLRYVIGV